LQAHLKALSAESQPKLLKELAEPETIVPDKKIKDKLTII
jgi:hypothetical protein